MTRLSKLNRGDKIFLDKDCKKESDVNQFLDCRDGVVEAYEYNDSAGYGAKTRLFYCQNHKHEQISIVRQIYNEIGKEWKEEIMHFDTASFEFLKGIIEGNEDVPGGKYLLVRHY